MQNGGWDYPLIGEALTDAGLGKIVNFKHHGGRRSEGHIARDTEVVGVGEDSVWGCGRGVCRGG